MNKGACFQALTPEFNTEDDTVEDKNRTPQVVLDLPITLEPHPYIPALTFTLRAHGLEFPDAH